MSTLTIIKLVIQVLIVSWIVYKFFNGVRTTKAIMIVRVFFTLAVLLLCATIFKLDLIQKIGSYLIIPICCLMFEVYQPELRRAFSTEAKSSFFRKGKQTSGDQLDVIIEACNILSKERRGALIVFPRQISLKSIVETGTKINADLSSSLIRTVFDHDTPLHDGAMIVESGKIVACGCYLPLSDQREISKIFGTRHRAALGMAEESDAVVLVVSEERGTKSLAYNRDLYYDLDGETIKRTLLSLLNYQSDTPEIIGEVNNEID